MKIERVRIRNFRSLKDVDVRLDDYTALAGANGSGKSSVLYALDWFFNGRAVSPEDVHCFDDEAENADCFFDVSVTFRDLSAADRVRLEKYGRGELAVFRRTWRRGEKEKVVGNAMQGPGFAAVRGMARVGEFRPAFKELRESVDGLADLGGAPAKDAVHAELDRWESDPANAKKLEEVQSSDATSMLGFNGENRLKQCVRLILIPAAANISSEVGDAGGKGSALNSLIGAVMAEAGARATAQWTAKNAEILDDLRRSVQESVGASTEVHAERVNARLSSLVPNAKLSLSTTLPDWSPRTTPMVRTNVEIDGISNDVSRQGHGVQRAVMMSMFQSLVPDADLTRSLHVAELDESDDQAAKRLTDELSQLPNLIVAIEEPEIYQHPIRSRTFARTLTALSELPKSQVLVATHSPYFIRPEQFGSLRRCAISDGATSILTASPDNLAKSAGLDIDKLKKFIDQRVPTDFSEGFFADAVILVEGVTDRAVLVPLCERLGMPLDASGISVIEMQGKSSLQIPYELFRSLGIPVHVVADGDFLGAKRKHPNDQAKQSESHNSHQAHTNSVLAWVDGTRDLDVDPAFGSPTSTRGELTLWHDDIEEELSGWQSFLTALALEGGALRDKNVHLYKAAVMNASLGDLPASLKDVASHLSSLGS